MAANPVLDVLNQHASVRAFTHEPVLEDDFAAAIQAGQRAATSSNIQSYCAVRIEDADKRERLIAATGGQKKVAECPLFLVICGDTRRHRLLAEASGAPYVANLEVFMLAVIDATLFAQNMVVAFESMGYGTCYIGGLRNDLVETDRILQLPSGVLPLYGLCVGRPAKPLSHRPRLDPAAVVFDERYPDDDRMMELMAEYDGRMAAWYAEQGHQAPDWTSRMRERFQDLHRARNAEFYRSRGASFV